MKKNTKTLLLVFMIFLSTLIKAQTNVSGGIFSNTTWSLSASPYIVTANVVVFPGLVLTIQPGVVVKFNAGVQLEIRQSSIVAWGTSTDSITFTSNTTSTAGSWNNINLNGGNMTSKFNFCNFRYATFGIEDGRAGTGDTLIIKNSNFNFNTTGWYGGGTGYGIIDTSNFTHNGTGGSYVYGSTLTKCNFSYNQTGFDCHSINTLNYCTLNHNQTGMGNMRNSSVNNCIVNNNQTGISAPNGVSVNNSIIDSNTVVGIDVIKTSNLTNCQFKNNLLAINDHNNAGMYSTITKCTIENNTTGIQLSVSGESIFCNKICNNTSYDLKYTGTNNVLVANNYWCTTDSIATQAVIYDGHNNVSYGLVNFMPLDTNQCYLTSGISDNKPQTLSFNVFPNPTSNDLTIELPTTTSKAEIKIYTLLGDLAYSSTVRTKKTEIDVSAFANGIYIIQIEAGNILSRQKFIKQ
jgi:hypothetical protein